MLKNISFKNIIYPTEKTTKWRCSSWDPSKKPFKLSSRCTIISCQNQTICASASQNQTSKFDVMNLIKVQSICVTHEKKNNIKDLKWNIGIKIIILIKSIAFKSLLEWQPCEMRQTEDWTDLIIYKACTQWKQRKTVSDLLEEYSLTLLSSVLFFLNCWQFEQKS